ncbi:hypothetical protein M0Q28_05585 [Patescibacteria group bacterium]|nr:hypothetical protein [Patescibacteria group bacterium]
MNRYAVNRACKKCGATNAKTEFQDAMRALLGREGKYPLMKRDCKRCGYTWYEWPLDAKDPGDVPEEKVRHIESDDGNAVCLCGEQVVDNGSGRFVCPKTFPKKGPVLPGSFMKESIEEGPKWETNCGCRWLVDPTKDMSEVGYPKAEVFARVPDFPCRNHKKGAA